MNGLRPTHRPPFPFFRPFSPLHLIYQRQASSFLTPISPGSPLRPSERMGKPRVDRGLQTGCCVPSQLRECETYYWVRNQMIRNTYLARTSAVRSKNQHRTLLAVAMRRQRKKKGTRTQWLRLRRPISITASWLLQQGDYMGYT